MAERINYTRIAVAIHPFKENKGFPRQQEIQAILDHPIFYMTYGLREPPNSMDYGRELYVVPRKIIEGPLWNPPKNNYTPLKYRQINPNNLINPESPITDLSITLIGGEVHPKGIFVGCHFSAFKDLINWFYSLENNLNHLQIIIPYDAVFTSNSSEEPLDILKNIKDFRKKYRDKRGMARYGKNKAVFLFKKK